MSFDLRPATDQDYELLWKIQRITIGPYVDITFGTSEAEQRKFFDERFDHAIEFGARALMTRRNAHHAVTDGEIHVAQNGRVEGEFAVEVVVDHGFVDAGAPGNAIDA
jgi:hypothetical protein